MEKWCLRPRTQRPWLVELSRLCNSNHVRCFFRCAMCVRSFPKIMKNSKKKRKLSIKNSLWINNHFMHHAIMYAIGFLFLFRSFIGHYKSLYFFINKQLLASKFLIELSFISFYIQSYNMYIIWLLVQWCILSLFISWKYKSNCQLHLCTEYV